MIWLVAVTRPRKYKASQFAHRFCFISMKAVYIKSAKRDMVDSIMNGRKAVDNLYRKI